MTNLFTSYFIVKNISRQKEFDQCLLNNIKCKDIDRIFLLIEYPIESELVNHEKVTTILIKGRPTYNVFFELINRHSQINDWNIISNSDIYFDDTLSNISKYETGKICLALTRWEVKRDRIELLNRVDSQDCWMIKGHVLNVRGDFELGKCGCDNAIADRLYKGGYDVVNPSKTIKTYHLHNSDFRTYNVNEKVPMPYKLLTPTT